MSTKICMAPWNGAPHKTTDATTLGQLRQMLDALSAFGYDIDTPVTFLYDDDHVWLETVEWVDERQRTARVVNALGDDCRGSEWIRQNTGSRYRYTDQGWKFYSTPEGKGVWIKAHPHETDGPYNGSYTEVIE